MFAYPFSALTQQQLKTENNKLNIYTQYLMKSTWNHMTFFSQACRTCGTTQFIHLCAILHATGFGLPPKFEDWEKGSTIYMQKNGKSTEDRETVPLFMSINKSITSVESTIGNQHIFIIIFFFLMHHAATNFYSTTRTLS